MKKLACLILFLAVNLLQADDKRPITFDDLYAYPQIEKMVLSPDAQKLALEVTEYDTDSGDIRSNIWIYNIGGKTLNQLTNSGQDTQPHWLPNSDEIAFISERPGGESGDSSSQIWTIPINGGEAGQLTDLYTGTGNPEWSPDGQFVIFESRVYPDCEDDDCNRIRDEEKAASPIKAMLYDKLLFRHYDEWADGKRNHLMLYDIEADEYRDQTPFDKDAPPIAGAATPGYCISPDASEICLIMNTDTVVAVSTNNDVFILNTVNNQLTRISTSPGDDDAPAYSPDGKYIAYRSMARAGYESDKRNLIIYNRFEKTYENLTDKFDRSVNEFIWGPFSKHIYFTAIDEGQSKIYSLNLKTKEIEPLITDAVCRDIRVSSNGLYLYYLRSTPTEPEEVYEYNSKNAKQTRLTFFSNESFSDLDLSAPIDFRFKGARDDSIHGLITLPPEFKEKSKYPLALLIHGGPQFAWLKNFNYYGWNTQLMAAQGYIVVQIDPHGSIGYGQPFTDAINNDWGGAPYQDLIMGLDYLIAHHDYIDTTRMAALGRSYGGYMVNWINGQTDRFACLISIDGSFENVSDYYSTDELWFPNWEFGGAPWQVKDNYIKQSPAEYVQNFNTPTLVIHGQLDYRVDVSQGIMMFTALQARNVPSRFLHFPNEGHGLSRLPDIQYAYEIQLEWLAKYLK